MNPTPGKEAPSTEPAATDSVFSDGNRRGVDDAPQLDGSESAINDENAETADAEDDFAGSRGTEADAVSRDKPTG